MTIDIDEKSGFCFGVVNAIARAEEEIERTGYLYSLGDIVAVHVKMGGFEKETSCMVNGADIKMTHEYSYEEPDLQSTAIQ